MRNRIFLITGGIAAAIFVLFLIYGLITRISSAGQRVDISLREDTSLLKEANDLASRGDLLKAKGLYQKILEKFPASDNILKIQEETDNVNLKILFSPIVTDDSFLYAVEKGDSLSKIAKKFNTTIDLITKANNLKSANIQAGRSLKISRARFSIVVDKSQNILTLKSDGNILKTYHVSTGQNFSTPAGTFKIINKIIDPVWYTQGAVVPADSPKNILGTRWLGISQPGYGIHGTTEPQSIGKQVTAGCVRMTNTDVEELCTIVPEGAEVVITD